MFSCYAGCGGKPEDGFKDTDTGQSTTIPITERYTVSVNSCKVVRYQVTISSKGTFQILADHNKQLS